MNNVIFTRLLSRTRVLYGNYDKYPRLIQNLANRSMTTNVSTSQIIKDKEIFQDALPSILDNLQTSPKISELPELGSWVKKVLQHNLRGGKHSRGLMTTFAYEMLEKPENITEENLRLSRTLGWCVEMLQAYFLVIDDVMDGSTTRRGFPCWYRMPEVGLGALNDAILIHCSITETLETYFENKPYYKRITKLFNEAFLYTSMGQHLDHTTSYTKKDYSLFTIERYESIVKYKTSCYTFRLPVLLGMCLVENVDTNIYADIDDICYKLGRLFQMQDDYIDCYGDEIVTGKAGTDIQGGKCSWLAVTALQQCNETQRETFNKYYASKDPDHVAIIKKLYKELQLPEIYRQQENEIYNYIVEKVKALPSETAPAFFYRLIDSTYKRTH